MGSVLDNAQKGAFEWQHLPGLFGHRYFHIPGTPDLQIRMPYYRPVATGTDLTLIDPDREQVIDVRGFQSKSRNSPFQG
jgi:dihydroorotase-like cyclic amidohydrolase